MYLRCLKCDTVCGFFIVSSRREIVQRFFDARPSSHFDAARQRRERQAYDERATADYHIVKHAFGVVAGKFWLVVIHGIDEAPFAVEFAVLVSARTRARTRRVCVLRRNKRFGGGLGARAFVYLLFVLLKHDRRVFIAVLLVASDF